MRTPAVGTPLGVLAERVTERLGDDTTVLFEGVETTSTQLHEASCRVAGGLAALGVRAGDRVALCMANCPEVLQTYRAVWRLGAAVTPLLFLLSVPELRHALIDCEATVIVTTPDFLPKVAEACAGLDVQRVVVGDGAAVDFAELAAAAPAPLAAVDTAAMAALLYTGGTTGRAKGVMLSHDALSAAAWSAVLSDSEDELRTSLLSLPIAHVFGLLVSTMSLHALSPKRVVLMRWFESSAWLRLVQDERVEQAAVVPAMLRALVAQPLERYDLSSLRRLTSGSAPLPADVVDAFAERLPDLEIAEGYGCSETAALATKAPAGRARRGSVGIAQPGVTLRIDGAGGSPDVDGEIWIRTPSLMTGYWADDAATAAAVEDGWFRSGDVGHLDADGFLYLVDRLKDVIIRNGFNVYPRDVEDAMTAHPDVAVCAVVGRRDDRVGEEVVAFIQLRDGAAVSEADLLAHAREQLAATKYPREIRIVDSVPLTSVGKLDRKALRTQL